jgi:hypothetical protein
MVLRDGAPVFDRLGRWFTLVCVGFAPGDALPAAAAAAAARRGLPLAVLRLDDPEVAKVYGRGLLLVRPDQHIAGAAAPAMIHARQMPSWRGFWDGAERVSENRATPIGGCSALSGACTTLAAARDLPTHGAGAFLYRLTDAS